VPHHKSCIKRLKTSEKARQANKSARSAIRTALKKVRAASTKEEAMKEVPRLYSMMDKAARKNLAGFSKNRAANYKSKVTAILAKLA
jgi:small subunit ribosomal protein S20